jgi:hypothetical protein
MDGPYSGWLGVFISASMALRCDSLFPWLGLSSYSRSMAVVSSTVASDATRQCDTSNERLSRPH